MLDFGVGVGTGVGTGVAAGAGVSAAGIKGVLVGRAVPIGGMVGVAEICTEAPTTLGVGVGREEQTGRSETDIQFF